MIELPFANVIYLVKHGSVAYGTSTPESDLDVKGVAVCKDFDYYLGIKQFEQKDKWSDNTDRVIYDIRKFINLATDCNPNIVEILYVDLVDIILISHTGILLRDNRDLFLSQKAAHTFVGYAYSQLKRIEGHYKWLQSPPAPPRKEDFVTTYKDIDKKFGNHEVKGVGDFEVTDWAAFDAAKRNHEHFVTWKQQRNPKRSALEADHGYDTKHAYHLVRLLRMGKEILLEGRVEVKRSDAAELLEIRNGKYSYKELMSLVDGLRNDVEAAKNKSPLPVQPDREKINQLLREIVLAHLEAK